MPWRKATGTSPARSASSRRRNRRDSPTVRQNGSLLRFVDERERTRTVADDEHPGLLVFGAVPMHLLGEVGHEGAGAHRHHIVLVDLVAGRDPPGALENRDVAVVRMEVRLA